MAATKRDISDWYDSGVRKGATHMVVVCDTYDHEDYPVYVTPDEDVYERAREFTGKNMQRVMEVYNLSMSKNEQLSQHRAFNY